MKLIEELNTLNELKEETTNEEILVERITDLKGYFKNRLKDKFEELGLNEANFIQLANLDPTHEEDTNTGGSYIEWLARIITNEIDTFDNVMEEAQEYKDQLSAFDDLKNRNKLPTDKKDIMRVENLHQLMSLVATRGREAEEGEEQVSISSDFQAAVRDFKELFLSLGGLESEDVSDNYKDHLELLCENDKWEVWKVNSRFGAYVLDQWGEGAKWCVGGMGWKGDEGKRAYDRYYPNYLEGEGWTYICFQQKDKNEPRPMNKLLITFDTERKNGINFNVSENYGYYPTGSRDATDSLAYFIKESGLKDALKNTELANCNAMVQLENEERLANGEPYIYTGDIIKKSFKEVIKKIAFPENEEEYEVTRDVLINGSKVNCKSIPDKAFRGIPNLEEVEVPAYIRYIGFKAFDNKDNVVIKTPKHKIICLPSDTEYLKQHITFTTN